jgi:hypothetical protein
VPSRDLKNHIFGAERPRNISKYGPAAIFPNVLMRRTTVDFGGNLEAYTDRWKLMQNPKSTGTRAFLIFEIQDACSTDGTQQSGGRPEELWRRWHLRGTTLTLTFNHFATRTTRRHAQFRSGA